MSSGSEVACESGYECARECILSAIECLSDLSAEGDSQASQTIADLSVILLGLPC